MDGRRPWIAVALVAASAAFASGGDTRHTDTSGGWSVEIPAGWTPYTAQSAKPGDTSGMLAALMSGSLLHSKTRYTGAADGEVALPSMTVSWKPVDLSLTTFDDIQKELSTAAVSPSWQAQAPLLDRQNARVTIVSSGDLEDAGPVTRRFVMCLGAKGVAELDMYCRSSELASAGAQFDRIVDSFRFDHGGQYSEPSLFDRINWPYVLAVTAAVLIAGFFKMIGRSMVSDGPRPKLRTRRPRRTPAPGSSVRRRR